MSKVFCLIVLAISGRQVIHSAPITVNVSDSQIEQNTFSNDVWRSPNVGPAVTQLGPGESAMFELQFEDNYVQLEDTGPSSSESVHLSIGGLGMGTGPRNFSFEISFDPAPDSPSVSPATGSGTTNAAGSVFDESFDVELVDGKAAIKGLTFTITNPAASTQDLNIGKVSIGLDADEVEAVPEPSTVLLCMIGLGVVLARAKSSRVTK